MSTLYLLTFTLCLTHLKCHSVFWQNVFIFYYDVHATVAIMGYKECNDAHSVGSTKSGVWCQMAITSATEISLALTGGMCLWGQPGLSHYTHRDTLKTPCSNTFYGNQIIQFPRHFCYNPDATPQTIEFPILSHCCTNLCIMVMIFFHQ